MKTGNFRKLLILVMLIAITSTFACSAGRDVYEVSSLAADSFTDLILPDPKPILKKKIMVAPVINNAGINDSQAEAIRQKCISNLSKDKYLLITKLKKWGDNDSASLLKTYGAVVNTASVRAVEEMGMDVLLTCIIHPIEVAEKRTGVWPFRSDKHNALVSISINALDTVNGTLIVYDEITTDINFKKAGSEESDNWTPDYNLLEDEISSVMKKLCSTVIEKLRKQLWQSKVKIDGSNLLINAGKDIGINEDTVFEVFKKGEPIESTSDEKYFIFGDKIGEAKAKSVSEDRSALTAKISGDLKDAAFVRVKRVR